MTEPRWDISADDLDDLVTQVREAGQDSAEVEAARSALSGAVNTLAPSGIEGYKRKLIVLALRYGGKALAWLLRHFSKEAAEYVLRHSKQLADFLDRAENWVQDKIIHFLVGCGVPHQYAVEIARILMALAG
ncbi:hypothetical protein [Nocardia heshunensis]